MARTRLLVSALAFALTATLAGWNGGPAEADPSTASTTTLEVSDETPAAGDVITLTATVSPAAVPPGQVFFGAAPTQDDLGSDDGGAFLGAVDVVDGQASVDVTVDVEDLPFLTDASDGFWVDARYYPDQASGVLPSISDPVFVDIVAPEPRGTGTTVTGPASAVVGVPTTLTAVVDPGDATGTVQFSVDDAAVGAPVAVDDGAASMPYTFTGSGDHTVRAAFTPADTAAFEASTDLAGRVVTVAPAVPPPAPTTTTTTVTVPATATAGTPVQLAATVTPAAAEGTVQFSVDGTPAGGPVPVSAGAASVFHTFTTPGSHSVLGVFTPTDSTAYSGSSGSDGTVVAAPPAATTVELAAPDRAVAGAAVSLTATVTPRDVPGRVTFVVDGRRVGVAPVSDGAAALSHRFVSIRTSSVTAVWKPADAGAYASSTAPEHLVRVVPGTTADEFADFLSASFRSLVFTPSCDGTRSGGPEAARDAPTVWTILITVLGPFFDLMRALFEQLSLKFTAVLCRGGARGAADTVTGTVTCRFTAAGLDCPLDVAAFSRLTISGSLPVPTDLAGQRFELGSTLTAVDPQTGESSPVDTAQSTVRVPRRTALSAHLTPRPPSVSSVRRGSAVSYRLAVRNPGVVTADHVRACVSVPAGARVSSATDGGRIRGRTACWRLPALEQGTGVVRTVVLRAPRAPGRLEVTALVRPRRSQADPVRLTAVLPVR